MKQCNWCDEADRQKQLQSTTSTAATATTATTSELPNGKKTPIESNSAIKGESKTSGSSKCAHHQHHRHHEQQQPIVVDTTGPLPPRSAAGADQKTKLGAIPAATAAAANPAAAGTGVESLAAFNLLPAHFRDMFLAAHLLRGKLYEGFPFFSTARKAITE